MTAFKGGELVRALKKLGWVVARIQGSHHVLKKTGNEAILTVPVHGGKDLKKGTQKAILKAAGLKENDIK